MPEINHRSRKILHAVVSEYLSTGEAVGSRKITRRHGIELSPATVRNVMADLEEAGLLEQPHTSAGRVPTSSGLRFFIDSLLKVRGLSAKEKDSIRTQAGLANNNLGDFDRIIQNTSRILSDITQYAGIVLAPDPSQDVLEHIEFMPMRGGNVLAILVTESGQIINKLIKVANPLERQGLESIHNYLLELLGGLTLRQVRKRVLEELGQEKNQYDKMVSSALELSRAAIEGVDDGGQVFVSGQSNLLVSDTGSGNVGQMRELLSALEQKELILQLLDDTMSSERVKVFLGAETTHAALGDSSIVAVPYGPDEQPLGAIAVVGPTRMNYGKIMSVVDFTAELVTRLALER